MERDTLRHSSDAHADTGLHGPPTADRFVVQDESHGRHSSVTNRTHSPDNWLGFYSRHHSLPADSIQPDAASAASDRDDSWASTEDGHDDDGLTTYRSDGSTPEPPLSARPKNLVNHPKILKDQLHRSMATLGTTRDVKFLNRSWTFAGSSR